MTHTPGPWFVVQHSPTTIWTIQNKEGGGGECVAKQYADSCSANADLIAAAPDLLEAIESILIYGDVYESGADGQSPYGRALAAVARAKGATE